MEYIKLFESWYDNRPDAKRTEYNKINIDWSKFLIDLDYTFEIYTQMNHNLETYWDEPYYNYTVYKGWEEPDEYYDEEEGSTYEDVYIKGEIKRFMEVYQEFKSRGKVINTERKMSLKSPNDINYNNLGQYWSFCHASQMFDQGENYYIIMVSDIPHNNIDWVNSLDNYVYFGHDECEVKVKKNHKVFLKHITIYKSKENGKYVPYNQQKSVKKVINEWCKT